MQRTIDISLMVLGAVILSCQMTMMYIFVGGGTAGSDAQALLVMQAWLAPVALLIFAVELLRRVAKVGLKSTLSAMWHSLPAWVVLALVVLNSLVFIGELAFFLRTQLSGQQPAWYEHAPLACVAACSLAFIVLFGRSTLARNGSGTTAGRW